MRFVAEVPAEDRISWSSSTRRRMGGVVTPRRGLIFHFTHIDNLGSIVRNGLRCDSGVVAEVEVGQASIKGRRARRTVPCGPGGVVADYVPFYFAARSPMLGSIHTGRVRSYRGGQEPIVYVVSHVDRVRELGLPAVVSDRNASLDLASFTDDLDEIDQFVDWPLMEQRAWNNTEGDPDRMERRMAELLVHQSLPWEAVIGVAAFDERRARQLEAILATVGVSTPVRVRRNWYF